MPNGLFGYYDEAQLRGVQSSAPAPSPAPATGWYGQIGNSTMYLGGLRADATPQEAAAYYAQQAQAPGSQFGTTRGMVDPSVYAAAFPNGDQQAYADLYRSTQRDINRGPLGVGSNLSRAFQFEMDHIGDIVSGAVKEPQRLVFGFDPLGTEIGNAVTGNNLDPLVNQMGGATSQQIQDYEAKHGLNSAGGAQGLHNAAAGTAAVIAAGTLANGGLTGGQGGGSGLTTMTPAEQAEIVSGLTNVPGGTSAGSVGFGGAGTAGLPADLAADFAGVKAGAAGNGLVLEGGAGTIGGSWLGPLTEYGPKVAGLANQGGGGGAAPMSGFMGSPMASRPAPVQSQSRQSMPLNQTMPRSRGYMRTPINYRGATIWL